MPGLADAWGLTPASTAPPQIFCAALLGRVFALDQTLLACLWQATAPLSRANANSKPTSASICAPKPPSVSRPWLAISLTLINGGHKDEKLIGAAHTGRSDKPSRQDADTYQREIGWNIDLLHGYLSLNGVTVILQA